MKKTLRLLITLDCNLKCEYCCNKLPDVIKKFEYKALDEIDFSLYNAVCISGGEPLLQRELIFDVLEPKRIEFRTPVYLYTNGLLLTDRDIQVFDGISIGIHYKEQIKEVLNKINVLYDKIKLCVEDIHKEEYLPNIPDKYIKTWSMNDCYNNVDTEDWVILKH